MTCVSVLYPYAPGKKFDHEYYAANHLPMVMDRCRSFGMTRYEIDRGLAGGAPGSPAPFVAAARLYFHTVDEFQNAMAAHGPEILGDIPNYSDIEIQIQVSELISGS
jgi:uncharacterized protein (TIGR02118 family)